MSTPLTSDKPYPFRLKELKAPLQKHAFEIDRSLAWIMGVALREYMKKRKIKFDKKKGPSATT